MPKLDADGRTSGASEARPRGTRSWIDVVDWALVAADRALDRVRKTPRRRLDVVPTPKVPEDPFGPKPSPAPPAAPAPAEVVAAPLGDPGLLVQIYGRRTCDPSGRVVKLLSGKSIPARLIDMDDENHRDLEARLIKETRSYATPYVFVRGAYLGGFERVIELDKSGELDRLLFEKGA